MPNIWVSLLHLGREGCHMDLGRKTIGDVDVEIAILINEAT
jgi:hypothetical protein